MITNSLVSYGAVSIHVYAKKKFVLNIYIFMCDFFETMKDQGNLKGPLTVNEKGSELFRII